MTIPEQVKIGYTDYKIKNSEKSLYLNGRPVYGLMNSDKGEIQLSTGDNWSIDQKNCTFIHEIIHGLDDFFDIGLKEGQTERLGKALYLFIKENPQIFKEDKENESDSGN